MSLADDAATACWTRLRAAGASESDLLELVGHAAGSGAEAAHAQALDTAEAVAVKAVAAAISPVAARLAILEHAVKAAGSEPLRSLVDVLAGVPPTSATHRPAHRRQGPLS